jgi:uncharacterized protein
VITASLIWIIRTLVILLIVRLVLRALFSRQLDARRQQAGPKRRTERAGGELIRDPQCGTYVPKSRAIAVGHGAHARYFCSTTCRDTYEHRSAAS